MLRIGDAVTKSLRGTRVRAAGRDDKYRMTVEIVRQLALTGCRRSEIVTLRWDDVDIESSCLRLADSKEGASVRPIGLSVMEYLEERRSKVSKTYVFPGGGEDTRRQRLEERLALARAMMGSVDPLDFIESWVAPEERYLSKFL